MSMRAIIYCRSAAASHGQTAALDPAINKQLQRCRQHAAQAGYDVRAEITELCSGRSMAHPRLEEWVHQHPRGADVVIVVSVDRLGRTLEAASAATVWLQCHGLRIDIIDPAPAHHESGPLLPRL
jgi:DNA invertase Pin-like site-specific DNA recombinase